MYVEDFVVVDSSRPNNSERGERTVGACSLLNCRSKTEWEVARDEVEDVSGAMESRCKEAYRFAVHKGWVRLKYLW